MEGDRRGKNRGLSKTLKSFTGIESRSYCCYAMGRHKKNILIFAKASYFGALYLKKILTKFR